MFGQMGPYKKGPPPGFGMLDSGTTLRSLVSTCNCYMLTVNMMTAAGRGWVGAARLRSPVSVQG